MSVSVETFLCAIPAVTRVYVGDLGTSGSRMELMKTFSEYGDIEDVWVAKNPPGFAFVYFRKIRDARDAVHALDGQFVCGRRVKVQIATGGKDLEEMRMMQQERAQMSGSSDQHYPRRPISVSPPRQRDSNRDRPSSSYRGGGGFGQQRGYGGSSYSGRDSYNDRGHTSYAGGSYGNRGGRTSSYRGRDSSFQSRGNDSQGYRSRDSYGGGRDNYSGGRDNYSGSRDSYGGGRDSYGGGRNNYSSGRDNYGGGRDSYGGGRDNYSGSRDNRWRDNAGARDSYGERQRGRDNNYQQTRGYRGRDSGMYETRDNYRGRDNFGGGNRDNFGDRQQGNYRQSYRGGGQSDRQYQRSYNQGYQQRGEYKNRRNEGGHTARAHSCSASWERQGSYSPYAGRETRRDQYTKEKYRSRSRSPLQARRSSSMHEESRAQLSHHSSPSRMEGELNSPEASGGRYTRRRYDNDELFEDSSHVKMSSEATQEDSLEEKSHKREHWDEDSSPSRFRM